MVISPQADLSKREVAMKISKESFIHVTAVFSVAILLHSAYGSAIVQHPEITDATLKSFFDSIVSTGTNVVFTFKKSGGRYLYTIGSQEPQVSRYGEVVPVPCDSGFTVCDRHLSLSFMPMRNTQGAVSFSLTYKKDFRSMGASVTTNTARLVSVPEPIGTMARTTQTTKERCLYGLQLLPLAPLRDSSQTEKGLDR